jgi:hypothetical protein
MYNGLGLVLCGIALIMLLAAYLKRHRRDIK